MKYLILLLFLPFFLYAETASEPVSMMTKAEIEKCSKNKEKINLRFLIRENGNQSKADSMLTSCKKYGWIPISMKNDWKTIYGTGVERTPKF